MIGTPAGVSLSWRPVVTFVLLLLVQEMSLSCHASHQAPHTDLTTEVPPMSRSWRINSTIPDIADEARETLTRRGSHRRRHNKSHERSESSYHTEHQRDTEMTPREVYSPWSSWSHCNARCEHKRERHCLHAPTCGNARHKEERSCTGGRCRQPSAPGLRFRVLRTSKRRGGGRGRGSSRGYQGVQVLSTPNHGSLFGKWSRWSPCTKTCTTRRYRWCKKPVICGNDVEREEAFCYVKHSFCHKWIFKRIRQHDENNEADSDSARADEDLDGAVVNPDLAVELGTQQQLCGMPHNVSNNAMALRIIGGRPAIRGRWPWQVAVLNKFKEAFCGGTLVASQWVLTAAHCVKKRLYVKIGDHNLHETEGSEIELRVEDTVIHPNYDADTVDNDLALLKLPGNGVRLDRYRGIACLPRSKHPLPVHKMCTIIGWGKRRPSDAVGTKLLHEAEVPIVPNEVCREVYEDYYITSNMFCAGHPRGRMDSCAGDSGGPLLCNVAGRWTIYGITSFGEGCGKRGKFGIYTKVPNYVKWIQRVTGSPS